MADTRTANISKLVLKQAGRAKEKVTEPPARIMMASLGGGSDCLVRVVRLGLGDLAM